MFLHLMKKELLFIWWNKWAIPPKEKYNQVGPSYADMNQVKFCYNEPKVGSY